MLEEAAVASVDSKDAEKMNKALVPPPPEQASAGSSSPEETATNHLDPIVIKPKDASVVARGTSNPTTETTDSLSTSSSIVDGQDTPMVTRRFQTHLSDNKLVDHSEQKKRLVDWYHEQREVRRRDREQAHLQTSQHCRYSHMHRAESKSSLLAIISGPQGSGKSTLAQTLKPVVEQQGAYFCSGAFDPLQRPEPYKAFVAAFAEFTQTVLDRGTTQQVKTAISKAVDNSEKVLTSMFPSLELILGNSDSAGGDETAPSDETALNSEETMKRFVVVFRLFIRAICTPTTPLVIVLDDLQWADPCSLEILSSMTTEARNIDLMVIGTVATSNDVAPNSVLSGKLREIELRLGTAIVDIQLHDLDEQAVGQIVATSLDLEDAADCETLTRLVCEQTQGNLLYTLQFLKWLQESQLLCYNDDTGRWVWDEDENQQTIKPQQTVHDFVSVKIELQLAPETRQVLQVAACLGYHLNEQHIEHVMGHAVAQNLNEGLEMGVLVIDKARGGFAFAHDCFQQAVYGSIPDTEKELMHLEIGRRLWRKFEKDEVERNIFLLLSHFSIGKRLLTREREKIALASLCLHAGEKAARSSTFLMAAVYLNLGIELLGVRGWRDEYELTLALHNAGAEMEMCTANFEHMNELIDKITEHARDQKDKVHAYTTRIYALGISNKQNESIDLGLKVLRTLGEEFPARLSKARIRREIGKVSKQMQRMTDEQLLRLPILEDEEKLAAIRIFQLIYLHSMMARPLLAPFVTMRSMQVALRYGVCAMSSACFASFGMICITHSGDIEGGLRYGRLGLAFLDKFGTIEYLPRVYAAYYSGIYPWKRPIQHSLEPLRKAHKVGLYTGDVEFALLCAKAYCAYAMGSGVPLGRIEEEWKAYRDMRQKSAMAVASSLIQSIHHFMGLTEDPLASKGDICDYDKEIEEATRNGQKGRLMHIRFYRMMVAYVFGAYDLADACSVDVKRLCAAYKTPPVFETVSAVFFGTMTALAMARKGSNRRENLQFARRIIKRFKGWATLSPYNYSGKQYLLQAELYSVVGRNADATKKYISAIALARESGFLLEIALANERTARHLHRIGKVRDAESYFRASCASYDEWGGYAKSRLLLEEVNAMYHSGEHNIRSLRCG